MSWRPLPNIAQPSAKTRRQLTVCKTTTDSDSDDDNSEIAQLNLVNGAQAAGLHEQRSQGALHACLVEQNIISNSWQRNAAAESLNIFGAAQNFP